jgi:hypothetical protein
VKNYEQPLVQEIEFPLERPPDLGPVIMETPIPHVESDQPNDSVDRNPPGVNGYDPQHDRRRYH